MKALVLILSAAAILFLTTCEEESPTTTNFDNALRTIKLLNLNDYSVKNIESTNDRIYSCFFEDSSLLVYSETYHNLVELNIRDLIIPSNYYIYFSDNFVSSIRVYPDQNSIFFSTNNDIFEIKDKGKFVLNHTKEYVNMSDQGPVLIGNSLLAYGTHSNYVSMVLLKNLETFDIDTLFSVQGQLLEPTFATEDESRLIFIEFGSPSSGNDGIKSLNLNDVQDVRLLTDLVPSSLTLEKSDNDKTAYVSDGAVYVLDLNTAEIKIIASGAEFASISNNGEKVVFTTQTELYIINSDGTNQQKLISKVAEKKYLFLPSFSSDDEQIVFVESDYPYYPNYQ